MPKMVALKRTIYGTKRLNKGDIFTASDTDAPLLKKLRRADMFTPRAKVIVSAPPVAAVQEIQRYTPLQALRKEYQDATGKIPDMRWGARTLRSAIDELQVQD